MYNQETGLYYLQSRYYSPKLCRFINSDVAISGVGGDILGYNVFAYCFNNPVNMSDSTGNWPRWIAVVITVVKVFVTGYKHISNRNSIINSQVDSDPLTTTHNKIVNDQYGTTGSAFEYGLYKAAHNACGTIAVHNAKVLEGIESSLSETISDFQSVGAMRGYGFFGSKSHAIGRVLKKEGIAYSRVGINEMTNTGTYIISFWNENPPWGGIHIVAVTYDGAAYTAYNLEGYGCPSPITLSDYKGRYICGYYLR